MHQEIAGPSLDAQTGTFTANLCTPLEIGGTRGEHDENQERLQSHHVVDVVLQTKP